MNDNNRVDVVSENIVKLIFDQVKDSTDKNTEAISKLTEVVTLLIHSVNGYPKETIEKVSSLSIFMRIVFGVMIGLFTILTFVFGYFGIGLNGLTSLVTELTKNIETIKPLLEKLMTLL